MTRPMRRLGPAVLALSVGVSAPGWALAQDLDCPDTANCTLLIDTGDNTEGLTELPIAPIMGEGFSISIDGVPASGGDPGFADIQRQADIAFYENDIDVRFDGLGVRPRLDAQVLGEGPYSPGQTVTFRSVMNYPGYVARGEILILDLDAPGGTRTLARVPLAPNGEVTTTLPEGETLAYVYRVIDGANRFDETRPVILGTSSDRGLTDLATEVEGSDNAAVRNIPVRGGAVTVFVENLPPGARVETLGTTVTPDGSGAAVIQRVLPAGARSIDVRVIRPDGRVTSISREVNIPKSEWFYVGVADVAYGTNSNAAADGGDDSYTSGRISGYAKGTTAGGFTITAQVDSGEDDLDEVFSNILDKDPNSILNRLDPELAYPTYGDDSRLDIDAPTSGGFYLKVEKDGNFGLWGDFKSIGPGTALLRNERTLYGAQTVLQTQEVNIDGAPRLRFEGYAAQPDQLPQRDVLRGTGGSVYFLTRQDILTGSETLTVELRDGTSQRVITRTELVQGEDYDINYTQGVITLYSPLSGYGNGGALLSSSPNGDDVLNLIAQYEWRPAVGDIDGYSYGGRLTSGIVDGLQLGATVQVDDSGTADQTAWGVDLAWELSERTFLQAEIAQTDGPGFGYISSFDGGLTGDTTAPPDGSGTAYMIEGQVALDEVWAGSAGLVSAYYQNYGAGFSSLDWQVDEPEQMWGFAAELPLGERADLLLTYDNYTQDPGTSDERARMVLAYQLTGTMAVELGYGYVDAVNPVGSDDGTGTRDDVALRLLMAPNELFEWYVFGQGSVNVTGDLEESNRVGVGGEIEVGETWSVQGEISDGVTGVGGRVIFGQDRGEDSNVYFGYTLDPDRTLDDVVLSGRDRGQFVAGARRRYSDSVTAFAENTLDLFGQRSSLASVYGVEYTLTESTIYTGAVETGTVTGDPDGEVDRTAVSFGVRHDDGLGFSTRGRVEYIYDNSDEGSIDTILLSGKARYELDDESRIVADIDAMFNETASDSLPEGNFFDFSVGYAFRPVLDDRLNVLAMYQYVDNGVAQEIDDFDISPLQRSSVFSLDAEYDLSEQWTIGGKLGARLGDSAFDMDTPYVSNDAWLVVANARYHLVYGWDVLVEGRNLTTIQGNTANFGALVGVYKQIGDNLMLGGSYNFGTFSDDLTDLTENDRGAEINLIAKF